MRYIEAPTRYEPQDGFSLFLAGGITGTDNWQTRVAALLADEDLVLLNPRRQCFPPDDPAASTAQIEWEYHHLNLAGAALFWFPPETLCPIALYELGRRVAGSRPLFVGTHPAYRRCSDLQVQLRLARPEIRIVESVEALAEQVRIVLRTKPIQEELAK
jgi:hypothetical protein